MLGLFSSSSPVLTPVLCPPKGFRLDILGSARWILSGMVPGRVVQQQEQLWMSPSTGSEAVSQRNKAWVEPLQVLASRCNVRLSHATQCCCASGKGYDPRQQGCL